MELDDQLREKVINYKPQSADFAYLKDVPLLFVVGISGAGKDTIARKLIHENPTEYRRLITTITRPPRENNGVLEQNDVDYHFINFATADKLIDARGYIETNIYSGNIYGTTAAELETAQKEDKITIGDIDVNGVGNFVRLELNVLPVFILPPSYDVWQQRLLKRYPGGNINHDDWLARVKTAKDEIEKALNADYFYLVVNDDLDQATATINSIAHGKQIEKRPATAVAVAQEIVSAIEKEL